MSNQKTNRVSAVFAASAAAATLGNFGPQLFAQTASGSRAPTTSLRGTATQPAQPATANVEGYATTAVVFGAASAGLLATRLVSSSNSQKRSNCNVTSLNAFENELGVQAPTGFWDPAGLSKDGNVDDFRRRRATELKHGRIAMLATMGYITPELTGKFPGYLSPSAGLKFSDVPNGLAAISKVPAGGWAQILGYMAFCEVSQEQKPGSAAYAGDFGWKLITSSDPAAKTKKLNAELANGRLAMMAIIGMFFQDGLTGSAWGDWALYTASPLRAFENELGVQAPTGFWDPAGLSKDGNVDDFRRRRATELKHGRIAMLATMGYITPELTGKFPGYLSPSAGLKFSDVPNGLAAISKVPAGGWAQILGYMAFCEVSQEQKPGTAAYAGDFGWKLITSSDPAAKTKKLNAELANGRLAMMAIIGMFFQDGLTGSAWGDWALYTASPLRATTAEAAETVPPPPPPFNPSTQVGALAPLGFFDPLGFAKTGDKEGFRNLRSAELKHARVAMMAALGAVVQHYVKFPGFESVPSGLGAVTTAPGSYGFAALFLLSGAMELAVWTQDPKKEIGDFGDPLGLGMYDGEMRNKELNNGRFAMFSALGIIAAEGFSGKDAIAQFGL
jgi:light-harvesting complex I chlorophyll a/b binding protein 1